MKGNQIISKYKSKLESISEVMLNPIDALEQAKGFCIETLKSFALEKIEDAEEIIRWILFYKIRIRTGKVDPWGNPIGKIATEDKMFRNNPSFLKDITNALGLKEPVVDKDYIEYLKANKNPNPLQFLMCIEKLMPSLDPKDFHRNLNNLKDSFNSLWNILSSTKSTFQLCQYLYSVEGGVGKGLYIKMIRAWAKARGIKMSLTKLPEGKFTGPEYSENAICYNPEATKSMLENWPKMNDILDGDKYGVEQKCRQPYEAPVRSFLICASNFLPKEDNSRRLRNSLVKFAGCEVIKDPKFSHYYKLDDDGLINFNYYVDIVEQCILSCPSSSFDYGKYSISLYSTASEWSEALDLDTQRQVLRNIANYCIKSEDQRLKEVSAEVLANRINKSYKASLAIFNNDDEPVKEAKNPYTIYVTLRKLSRVGLIKLVRSSSCAVNTRFDITNLAENAPSIFEDAYNGDNADLTIMEQQEKLVFEVAEQLTREGWVWNLSPKEEEIILEEEEMNAPLIDTSKECEVDFNRTTYSELYSNIPHFNNSEDEFMLNGRFKDSYMKKCMEGNERISRSSDNIIPEYFVFESDTLPIEKQIDLINSLPSKTTRYIRSITYSGNKSIHVLFSIKCPEDIKSEEYSKLWYKFMEDNNLKEYADAACKSMVRLTRNPNGMRSNGKKQSCYYCNPNNDILDLSDQLKEIREDEEFIRYSNEFLNKKERKEYPQVSRTPEEVLGGIKKECAAKRGWQMIQSNDFPKGEDFLAPARGMHNVLVNSGIDSQEAQQWIRENYLLKVAEEHPTNISKSRALNWKCK